MAPPAAAAVAPAQAPRLDDYNETDWYEAKLKDKKVELLDAAVEVG